MIEPLPDLQEEVDEEFILADPPKINCLAEVVTQKWVGFAPLCNDNGFTPNKPKSVYAVLCITSNRVKIGITDDLGDRLKQLRSMSPTELTLIAEWFTYGYELESYIHEQLSSYRLHGEWFTYNEFVKGFIDDLNSDEKRAEKDALRRQQEREANDESKDHESVDN